MATTPDLVLASASPRRRELLSGLGIDFSVRPVDLDESARPGEGPRELVERLARSKALERIEPGEIVLAADTLVVLDDEILGKPTDPEDAVGMLSRLQGRDHVVFTGVAVVDADTGRIVVDTIRTSVRIGSMSEERIRAYVATGEPLDKAGAYAIQGLGSTFVESIDGNYTNVVGLPIPTVAALVRELGHELSAFGA